MTLSVPTAPGIGWFTIIRLGAVQAAIGAMVMLATSLLNRVMVVEYGIAAAIPAALVAWHYAVQLSRPPWGHRSDRAARRHEVEQRIATVDQTQPLAVQISHGAESPTDAAQSGRRFAAQAAGSTPCCGWPASCAETTRVLPQQDPAP